ncbi:MAG: cobyric acid synthase [Dehalococcoidales bacterium]|nr:cobyric acid synthase [Dehalococcoidales bacterium]
MPTAGTIMVQGTASSVGKSILVAALCRIFRQDGLRVAPFKSQNMALNSFITAGGGEMGRAQVVQAEAAGILPTIDMNPVLLKPEADSRCQVIVRGKVAKTLSAGDYYLYTPELLKIVEDSLQRLRSDYDIVVIEGAGSPAEINLKEREIVNMRIARMAESPVLLVGDIDRGGVFASLIGTLALLEEDERNFVKGLIINKFRGDIKLLQPGLAMLAQRAQKPVLGVVPYLREIQQIAQEDSVYLDERQTGQEGHDLDIAVIRLPHISNYDDFDPLESECRVRYVSRPGELGKPRLIILPGTKSTINDLNWLRESGLADLILHQAKTGTPVAGICGGYQMLGKTIRDPDRTESTEGEAAGLGLLDVTTSFAADKATRQVTAQVAASRGLFDGCSAQEVAGYEIHMGQTESGEKVFHVTATPEGQADFGDGAIDAAGTVFGTYLHGLFANDRFRQSFLANLRRHWDLPEKTAAAPLSKEQQYDKLAEVVRGSLDMAAVYRILASGIGI